MTHGMVRAPQPEAVEAGALVLRDGGNAVDAAVACALVQTAVDPQMCGIAGFGSLHIHAPALGVHQVLDFHSRAPLAAREDMWADLVEAETEDGFGFVLEGRVNEIGYPSITTPMTLKALSTALERWGTRPLAELIQPAIGYAEDGFMIRPHVAYYWSLKSDSGRVSTLQRLQSSSETRRIYLKADGSLRQPGEVLRNPDMTRTYRRIAEHGAEDFYHGQLAEEIAADMAANGALMSGEDLAAVALEDGEPLWGSYRGRRVASNPPPGGGVMVLEMLNILEHFDLAAMSHNSPDYIATVSEAMKIATVDKDRQVALLGDVSDHPVRRRQTRTADRRAGRHLHHHGRAAGYPQRHRFRHGRAAGGVGAALLHHLGRDRRDQPDPAFRAARAGGQGLPGAPLLPRLPLRRGTRDPPER